jgi:pyruvate,orthophosphate dikinase
MNGYVFPFGGPEASSDPRARDKAVVGGKGANLAGMAAIGLPVPRASRSARKLRRLCAG